MNTTTERIIKIIDDIDVLEWQGHQFQLNKTGTHDLHELGRIAYYLASELQTVNEAIVKDAASFARDMTKLAEQGRTGFITTVGQDATRIERSIAQQSVLENALTTVVFELRNAGFQIN